VKKHRLLISFFGPSGAGKSTCFSYANSLLRLGYQVHQLDVAKPLRLVQKHAYQIFGRDPPGNPDQPAVFRQDGQLLSFLAKHFENDLGAYFLKELAKITEAEKKSQQPMAIINTDCRNNMYELLQTLGFVFIRLDVQSELLQKRQIERGDLSPYHPRKAVEQYNAIKPAYIIKNNGSLRELESQVHEIIIKIIP